MSETIREDTGVLRRVEQIMGMPIGIDVRDQDVDPSALDLAFDWLRSVDAMFSTYKSDSEISRLNRGELSPDAAHPDVRYILERCEQLIAETGGYFDHRAPFSAPALQVQGPAHGTGALDPSGLVKGWSVDRAARILETTGARNYYVNAGGDIRVRGGALPLPRWRIGIQHPLQRDKVAAVIGATYLAIATSGTYERGSHIVDPHTGQPPGGVLSVTITGPDLATADAYATAAFAMGRSGPAWTARLDGFEAMTILDDETVLYTPGFPVVQ
jgi:FAD:protein FMN transferase